MEKTWGGFKKVAQNNDLHCRFENGKGNPNLKGWGKMRMKLIASACFYISAISYATVPCQPVV
jgi:hypothetical protein